MIESCDKIFPIVPGVPSPGALIRERAPRRRSVAVRTMLIVLLCLVGIPVSAFAGWVGSYNWGGMLAQGIGRQQIYNTVNATLSQGFDTIRVAITPTGISSYNLTGADCPNGENLGCFAAILFGSTVWDNPRLKRIILTTADWACYTSKDRVRSNGCLTASTLSARKAAIESEYAGLFDVLLKRFGTRHIEFIVTNWEGDNWVYCGSAYDFAKSAEKAARCREEFPNGQTNAQRAAAFLQWVDYKTEAAAEFRKSHPGFDVVSAPEFNVYRLFDGGCHGHCDPRTDTVLAQIGRRGGYPLCLYSAYDSINTKKLAADLPGILASCRKLIIGEAGFNRKTQTDAAIRSLWQEVARAADNPNVLGTVIWNEVSPQNRSQEFGLLTPSGAPDEMGLMGPLLTAQAPR